MADNVIVYLPALQERKRLFEHLSDCTDHLHIYELKLIAVFVNFLTDKLVLQTYVG